MLLFCTISPVAIAADGARALIHFCLHEIALWHSPKSTTYYVEPQEILWLDRFSDFHVGSFDLLMQLSTP